MAEITGYAPHIFPQAINCAAPDTGNMGTLSFPPSIAPYLPCSSPDLLFRTLQPTEVFAKYASPSQKSLYLTPLLEGKIRSSFAMTEFGVSSSDATNVRTEIRREEGGAVVVSGRKWVSAGLNHLEGRRGREGVKKEADERFWWWRGIVDLWCWRSA